MSPSLTFILARSWTPLNDLGPQLLVSYYIWACTPPPVDRVPAVDGTAFRAVVNIKYAEWLVEPEQNNGTWVADFLWPAINLDLQWIASNWNQSS
jgi:hypothetical protein